MPTAWADILPWPAVRPARRYLRFRLLYRIHIGAFPLCSMPMQPVALLPTLPLSPEVLLHPQKVDLHLRRFSCALTVRILVRLEAIHLPAVADDGAVGMGDGRAPVTRLGL
jgi:hypothetical protein